MRVGGARRDSCTVTIPGMGSKSLPVVTLGYGVSVAHSVGEARSQRTFYPFIKTSGQWYIEAHFSSANERNDFHRWVFAYIRRITDPNSTPLPPMVVSVPSRKFSKVGYPTSSVEFGDAVGTAVYRSIVQFTSASDPTGRADGSQFSAASSDYVASQFYPGGSQAGALPIPAPMQPGYDNARPWT